MLEIFLATSVSTLTGLWLVIFLASILRAFTGFGFALCAVPGFSFFLSPVDSAVLAVMLTLAISVLTVRHYACDYSIKSISPILLMACFGTFLGARMLIKIDAVHFRALVGSIVIFATLLLSIYRPKMQVQSKFFSVSAGFTSGLMNGAFAIPGPPIIFYAMIAEPEPHRSRAMLMQFFAAAAFFGALSFFLAGLIHSGIIGIFCISMPMMILGNYIGNTLFAYHGHRSYRIVALVVSMILGFAALICSAGLRVE